MIRPLICLAAIWICVPLAQADAQRPTRTDSIVAVTGPGADSPPADSCHMAPDSTGYVHIGPRGTGPQRYCQWTSADSVSTWFVVSDSGGQPLVIARHWAAGLDSARARLDSVKQSLSRRLGNPDVCASGGFRWRTRVWSLLLQLIPNSDVTPKPANTRWYVNLVAQADLSLKC